MKKFKKIIAAVLCLLMLPCAVFANTEGAAGESETDSVSTAAIKTYTLNLKEAIKLALDENPQLEVCDIKKKNNEVQLDAAYLTMGANKNTPVYANSNYELNYLKKGYYVETYKSALRLSDKEKDNVTASISYNVTEKYYNYKLGERLVEISKNAYELALENKSVVDAQFELGLISELEVKNAQVAVNQIKYDMESNTRNLELLKESLKIDLQLSGENCNFNLTDSIGFTDYESNADKDIDAALKTRYDAASIYESYCLAKLYLELTGTPKNTATYNAAYSSYIQSEYNYDNSFKMLALKIRSAYNDVLTARNNLEIAERNLEIRKQEYEVDKLRFELGMITNITLTATLNNMTAQEINLSNAQLKYKLAVEKYQYEISVGL